VVSVLTWAAEHASATLQALDGAYAGDGVVMAVVAIDADGAVVTRSDRCPANARLEIGSVTKTMTATLLASVMADGQLGLDDQIGDWLSAGPNASISVVQLGTHTSGLAGLAPNQERSSANPYAGFTAELAEAGLRHAQRAPGPGLLIPTPAISCSGWCWSAQRDALTGGL
jgi:D-alanyl-D-alanine-carboxypeptidase/D-alanyl-D-alanine-endopeptidase